MFLSLTNVLKELSNIADGFSQGTHLKFSLIQLFDVFVTEDFFGNLVISRTGVLPTFLPVSINVSSLIFQHLQGQVKWQFFNDL